MQYSAATMTEIRMIAPRIAPMIIAEWLLGCVLFNPSPSVPDVLDGLVDAVD
jgi:hypothetical protein